MYSPQKCSRPAVGKNYVRGTSTDLQHTKPCLWDTGDSTKHICRKTVACRPEAAEKSLAQTEMSLSGSERVTEEGGGSSGCQSRLFPWLDQPRWCHS